MKPIVDGIVAAKVIPDDNGEKVSRVVLMAKVGMEKDRVLISIV